MVEMTIQQFLVAFVMLLALVTGLSPAVIAEQVGGMLGRGGAGGGVSIPTPPSGVTVSSPANGATSVEMSTLIMCSGNGVTSWEARVDTENPLTTAYVDLGSHREYTPATPFENSTTYYAQCRGTNSAGTDTSAVSSFTTIVPTSTGTHPKLLVTSARQTVWAQMKADYTSKSTSMGSVLYGAAITQSNGGPVYFNYGITDAWLANVPGNDAAFYCGRAWTATTSNAPAANFLGTNNVPPSGGIYNLNNNREYFTDWVLIYDLCYQSWTQPQRDQYLAQLNTLATYNIQTQYPNGWRCGDYDQPIGNYFGIAALYEATKEYNPTIVALWADDDLGGYTAEAVECSPVQNPKKTLRNMVKFYYETTAAGGTWPEGLEYGFGSPTLGIRGCEALRTTDAGDAPCAEIDAWVEDFARHLTQMVTRDTTQIMQYGDEEHPRNFVTRWKSSGISQTFLALTDVVPDGQARQDLMRVITNFRTRHGDTNFIPSQIGRVAILVNPYATASADLSGVAQCFQSQPYGVHIWNTGLDTGDAQFHFHFQEIGIRGGDHHQLMFGAWQWYRKGQFIVTQPHAYGGVNFIPEGTSATAIEGLGVFPSPYDGIDGFREVTGQTCGSDFMYVEGTQAGMRRGTVRRTGATELLRSAAELCPRAQSQTPCAVYAGGYL